MADKKLIFDLLAKDGVSNVFDRIGKKSEGLHGNFAKLATVGVAAVGAVATGVEEFARRSIDKFQEVGSETLALQRIMGGTPETVSRLRFAAQETGVAADALGVGIKKFSTFSQGAHDGAKANIKAFHDLGVTFQDAHGHMLPVSDTLLQVADRFHNMPNGVSKTAEAVKLFGKRGLELLPFLNRGADGIRDLEKESDKLGLTMSGKDLKAIKDNVKAHREFHAMIEGVQVQVGRFLYPALTKGAEAFSKLFAKLTDGKKDTAGFAGFIESKLIPAVQKIAHFVVDQWVPAMMRLWQWVGKVAKEVLPEAKKQFDKIAEAIAKNKPQIASFMDGLKTLAKTVGPILKLLFKDIGGQIATTIVVFGALMRAAGFLKTVMVGAFRFIANVFLTVVGTLINGAAKAFGWVPGVGPKLKAAAAHFNTFRDTAMNALNGIDGNIPISVTGEAAAERALGRVANAALAAHLAGVNISVTAGSATQRRAAGGPVTAGTPYIVGEHRPELFIPSQSGYIAPRVPAGGDTYHITVVTNDPQVLVQKLLSLKRRNGGQALGIA